jgi:DNA-binding IclR family transcriptional regulator
VVYVDRLQGTRAVRIVVSAVGSTLPAHCSGVGKVLLARLPWGEVERHLEQHGMQRFTAHTITTPERLREELARVRRAGCAYDLEEAVLDVCCVAAPIVDHLGEAVAAISLSVPAYRFRASRERYRTAIVEAAASVSRRLGHVPAPRRLTSVAR